MRGPALSHFHQKATRVVVPPNSDSGSARHDELQSRPLLLPSGSVSAPLIHHKPPSVPATHLRDKLGGLLHEYYRAAA